MTDAITTSGFRTTQDISGADAAKLEAKHENEVIGKLEDNKGAIDSALVTLSTGGKISSTDASNLADLAGNLTAADLKNLVSEGTLSQDEANLLLAASSFKNFDETGDQITLGGSKIATGINNLFALSHEDRQFVMDTFAQQGGYSRVLDIGASAGGDPELNYTLSDVRGRPIDLPSTPEIQRAMMFLMDENSPTDKPGAVVAFTNWNFDTSSDELGAMLGNMTSFEGVSSDIVSKMADYISQAGQLAGPGPVDAKPEDVTKADQIIADETQRISDLSTLENALKLNESTKPKNLDVTINGETKKASEWLKELNVSQPNWDGDNTWNDTERAAAYSNLDGQIGLSSKHIGVQNAIKAGLPDDQVAQLRENFIDYKNAETARESMHSMNADHKIGTFTFHGHDNQYEMMDYTDPKTGETSKMDIRDYLAQSGAAFPGPGNTAGIGYEFPVGDNKYNDKELRSIEQGLADLQTNLDNQSTNILFAAKSSIDGFQPLNDKMQDAMDLQKDWQNCLDALEGSGGYSDNNGASPDKVKFTTSDGKVTDAASFMKDQGYEYPSRKHSTAHWGGFMGMQMKVDKSDNWMGYGKEMVAAREYYTENVLPGIQSDITDAKAGLQALQPPVVDADLGVHQHASQLVNVPVITDDQGWDAVIDGSGDGDGTVSSDGTAVRSGDGQIQSFGDASVDADGNITVKNDDGEDVVMDADQLTAHFAEGGADALAKYGFSPGDQIDLGMLMFMIMGDRITMLGEQIQDITREQAKNTNDQSDINKVNAALQSGQDPITLASTNITLSDGTTTTLAAYFQAKGITTTGSDGVLKGDEISTQVELVKTKGDGLASEGQQIMNELTQLSQKYQQSVSLMMNFLEKFDSMKQKVIDKIRAN